MKPLYRKIAVIDDSPPFRLLVKQMLELNEDQVDLFEDAETFFKQRAAQAQYNLIIVDWNLPGMNGLNALESLKASPLTSSIPVLIVTGDSSLNHVRQAIHAGVNDFISKPIDPHQFMERVTKLLGS
ncbi:PleD family two-component system response regulator [Paenibacillus sp. HJGM_3]|uniref:response regulator n=1 Tax=Paenibacillus sp. HJGM_3 TaxID=3379816 RepID=UPI003858978F